MKKLTPYQEGFKAFKEGNLGNPYNENTSRNRDWELGFNKAYFSNLDYQKKREQGRRSPKKKAPVH